MGQTAENNLWYKGKSEVLREFKKSVVTILSAVASRNFSAMPGFAIEALTDVEIDSKFKLTEYNQKILGDAIDRELKDLGLANDISLKQATMAWELAKIQLFSDMQKEFSDKELIRSLRDEELENLMIDQSFREVAILMQKLSIELQIQDINRQKEEVGLLALPLEEQLAAATLATARRKLAVIPYILAVLAAQNDVLDIEATVLMPARQEKANYDKQVADMTTTDILPLMADKAAKTLVLTETQAELIPLMLAKATASKELADEMMAQLDNHRLIAEEKVILAGEKILRLAEQLVLMGKDLTLEGKKITIEQSRAALELQKAEARLVIVDALRIQLGEIKTAMTAESAEEIVYINTQGLNEIAVKKARLELVDAARYAATATEMASQTHALSVMASDDKIHSIEMAKRAGKAEITERLIHLLS